MKLTLCRFLAEAGGSERSLGRTAKCSLISQHLQPPAEVGEVRYRLMTGHIFLFVHINRCAIRECFAVGSVEGFQIYSVEANHVEFKNGSQLCVAEVIIMVLDVFAVFLVVDNKDGVVPMYKLLWPVALLAYRC